MISSFKAAGKTAPGQQPDINLGLSAHGMAAIAADSGLLRQTTDPRNSERGEGIKGPAWPPLPHDSNQELKSNEGTQNARVFQRPGLLAPTLHPRSALHWSRGWELGAKRALEVGWGLPTSPPSLSPSQPSVCPERCWQHFVVRMRRPEAWLRG